MWLSKQVVLLSSCHHPATILPSTMALRNPVWQLCKHATSSSLPRTVATCTRHVPLQQIASTAPPRRSMAMVVPPVTQDATSSQGPTAMVFMNMGGPSTTDEVGDFLSRLFVSTLTPYYTKPYTFSKLLILMQPHSGRRRPHPPRPSSILPRSPNIPSPHPKDQKTIRRYWWRLSYP